MRRGLLIAVAGPSGAGKDTLLALARKQLLDHPHIVFATRIITREPDASEPYIAMNEADFVRDETAGKFLLAWNANGMRYALPAALRADLEAGHAVVANLSRGVVDQARGLGFPTLVIEITAHPHTLESRLATRGRENEEARRARLDRNETYRNSFTPDDVVVNDGSPQIGASRLADIIRASVERVATP